MNRKRMINYLIITILVYLGSLAYLFFNQRNMIYFPDIARPDIPTGAEIIKVTDKDGVAVEGWYFPPRDEGMPVLLHFHGNAGNNSHRVWKARLLNSQGYGVLLAGYRGYGGNPGQITEQGLYADARAYMEFLKTKKNPIVLHGESLGTGIAVRMANEYDVAGLILESPYTSIGEVAQSIYPIVPVRWLLQDKFPSIDIIGEIKAPKLFIHGARDRTIPLRFGQKLFKAASEPKTFIALETAGHNDLYEYGAALHVLQFLSTIGPSRPLDGKAKE
jgi:fermentation-respiration switch protein FrsA (DUF1100 family)